MDRRQFLQLASGTVVATPVVHNLLAAQPLEQSPPIPSRGASVELRAWTAKGIPMPTGVMDQIYFLDLADEPLVNRPRQSAEGRLWSPAPEFPFAIAVGFAVQGFGHQMLYADNQGQGYTPADFPLNLNLACGRTRLHRVRSAITTWQATGYHCSPAIEAQLQRAAAKLQRAEAATEDTQMAGWANESLRDSLWAGETAVIEQAKQQIAQRGPRPKFLWGCNFFKHPEAGPDYDHHFRALFNFATLPTYWQPFEPQAGQSQFAQLERSVQWLRQAGITPKGHPLVWFHELGVPDWVKNQSYAQVRDLTRQRVTQMTAHFRDRMPYYDLINEAHDIDWANILNFSGDQLLEMTQVAAVAAAAGYPQVQRIINVCCAWSLYVARSSGQRSHRSAYQYLQACLRAKIPFEYIGIQLYYPDQDMFEINRLLDRFGQLGKPIHITELGVSSATTRDEASFYKDPPGLWHGPWSEAIQADWVEQFYTLCFSKPYIQAVSWWDFSDRGFWPHGGLLQSDNRPKVAYDRLRTLRHQWMG